MLFLPIAINAKYLKCFQVPLLEVQDIAPTIKEKEKEEEAKTFFFHRGGLKKYKFNI